MDEKLGAEMRALSALEPYEGFAAGRIMACLKEAAQALTLAQARIRELEKRADHYGVALMMIRAGCSDPARFAGNILDDKQPIDIDIEDELP